MVVVPIARVDEWPLPLVVGARQPWGKQGARLPWWVYRMSWCRSRSPSCPRGGNDPRDYDVVAVPIVRVDKWPLLLVYRTPV